VLAPQRWRGDAFIVDLSPFGICLGVPGGVEEGSLLRLCLSNFQQLLRHEVTLRVSHARGLKRAACLAGGPFEQPLPLRVMQALMG
jgi:hypothetical protein